MANLQTTRIVTITKFAAIGQFKGVHDKVGDIAKQTVLTREKSQEVRCSSAYEWFTAAERLMQKPQVQINKRNIVVTVIC